MVDGASNIDFVHVRAVVLLVDLKLARNIRDDGTPFRFCISRCCHIGSGCVVVAGQWLSSFSFSFV
jgi:hypothetical protein